MFACLYSLSVPAAALVKVAEDFTPRFEVIEPQVMLDLSGLSRLFGSPREIGEQLYKACAVDPRDSHVRIAMAPTQTTASLLALGRVGLTVVMPGEEAQMLAKLPVTLLGDFDRLSAFARGSALRTPHSALSTPHLEFVPPNVTEMEDVLPYFQSMLHRASDAARVAHMGCGGGWRHPRESHAANQVRSAKCEVRSVKCDVRSAEATLPPHFAHCTPHAARRTPHSALTEIQALCDTLRRWGIKTLGALAALPPADVYERLGARGVLWQRRARGEDQAPLVPYVPEDPFEARLELEWPIEGLEPLSFVLTRLLEPLSARLERADRGAAVLHTHLRLVSKAVHARTLQLPAPMREVKTLRTLILLDLESHPPAAAIDRVSVLIEPTPARVTQWMLFERAQPSPEQVSTLLARLAALMGESHVGSPRLLESWKPGVFAMDSFQVRSPHSALSTPHSARGGPHSALRRFRLPIPVRVQVHEGRPVRVTTDRRGVSGGAIVQAAGPWRTSGEWWNDQPDLPSPSRPTNWDRDEWDVAIADGTVYRIVVERDVGQWFVEGVVD